MPSASRETRSPLEPKLTYSISIPRAAPSSAQRESGEPDEEDALTLAMSLRWRTAGVQVLNSRANATPLPRTLAGRGHSLAAPTTGRGGVALRGGWCA